MTQTTITDNSTICASASNFENSRNKQQFWQVRLDELKMLYRKKWITATFYVYGIVKILKKDGWWLRTSTKQFAKEFEIPPKTLYRAITTLAADGDINFEWSAKDIRMRFGEAEPAILTDEKTPESIDLPLGHSQQDELVSSVRKKGHPREKKDIHEKKRTSMRKSQPETLTQQSVQPSFRYYSDIKQTHTDSALANATPLPHPGVCDLENFGNEEEQQKQASIQDPITHIDSSSVQQNQDPAIMSKSTHEDKNCAAPPENDSHSLSGDPELLNEFYKWQGAEMNKGKEATTRAANLRSGRNWARKYPEDAIAVFEEWKKDRATTSKPSRYDRYHEQQHALVLKEYQIALEKAEWGQRIFLEQFERNNPGWLEWVGVNHPEWLQIAA